MRVEFYIVKFTDLVPSYFFRYIHALHIDTQEFSQYIQDNIRHEVDFIDDIAEEINSDGKNIQSIKFKNSGEVTADFFIDASGFSSVLLEKLNPEWNDIRDMLPMDRQSHNKFRMISKKFHHTLWQKQENTDGSGEYQSVIDLNWICLFL